MARRDSEREQRLQAIGEEMPAGDVVERIVHKNRERFGRATTESVTIPEKPTKYTDVPVDRYTDIPTDTQADVLTGIRTDTSTDGQADTLRADASTSRSPAASKARQLGASPLRAFTVKLPEAILDYLDEYQHAHWREGILRQDLVKRAFQLLVVELESGEKLADI